MNEHDKRYVDVVRDLSTRITEDVGPVLAAIMDDNKVAFVVIIPDLPQGPLISSANMAPADVRKLITDLGTMIAKNGHVEVSRGEGVITEQVDLDPSKGLH